MSYFLKRLFLFIPTLLILSVFFFYLSRMAPGDPILNKIEANEFQESTEKELEQLRQIKRKYGLDLPLFYFSVHRKTSTDTLSRIPNQAVRETLLSWAYFAGSWEKVNRLYQSIEYSLKSNRTSKEEKKYMQEILRTQRPVEFPPVPPSMADNPSFSNFLKSLQAIRKPKKRLNNFLLSFKWHGLKNQYHQWLWSILQGDFGRSLIDGRKSSTKIKEALKWTLTLSFSALFLALLIAIPAAIYNSLHPKSCYSRILNFSLLGLYSVPNFWLATILIIYLTGGDYLRWFPSYGLGQVESGSSIFEIIVLRVSHLFLPVICITYPSLAYLYKQMKNSMQRELDAPYIRTARSKGLSTNKVAWKHAFKNAGLPLITLVGKALPALVSGSFIIEYIFSIQGMGKLSIDSFLSRDYPVIFGVLMLISMVTLIGSWLTDVFYQKIDPRISVGGKKQSQG